MCSRGLAGALILVAPAMLCARVTKITITSRGAGPVGTYEKIKGIATGDIDPLGAQ